MRTSTKRLCFTAIGVALYVALSMMVKVPLFTGHLALDIGYVVLAVYAYQFGAIPAAIVGGAGCCLVSMLSSGWFPPGWILGNIFIGLVVGFFAQGKNPIPALIAVVPSTFIGIGIIKTAVECWLYAIPWEVKFAKNMVAFVADTIVMVLGCVLATILQSRLSNEQTGLSYPDDCPLGGDTDNDCDGCIYSGDYHFDKETGCCVARPEQK